MEWSVELSDEVADWYRSLTPAGKAVTDRIFQRLESEGYMLRMPNSKALEDDLYELRFMCEGVARRITYTREQQRRVITLTTFRKQRNNERREILRARRALRARKDQQMGGQR